MNAISSMSDSERIQFRKKLNSMKLDDAIEQYVRAYEDARDRGLSTKDMRAFVSDMVNLFYAKWEMD